MQLKTSQCRINIARLACLRPLGICVLLWAFLVPAHVVATERGASRGSSATAEVDLRADLYALVIGVSRYRAGWDPLPGVQHDIDAVSTRLGQSGFNVTVVMDPDRATLERAFAVAASKLKGRDLPGRLLVYYAGHGENLDGEGYLVPIDAPLPQINRPGFIRKAVPLNWVRQQMLTLPARQVLMLLDNCFAGAVFSTMRGTPLYPPAIGYMVASRSRAIIAAGTETQTVPDESIFRNYFVAALAGAGDIDKDGYITGTEISIFLRSNVANESRGRQTPLFAKLTEDGFYKGDFVVLSPLHGSASPVVAEDLDEPLPPAASRSSGVTFRDCEQDFCPRMIAIPRGSFTFGAPANEQERSQDDLPPTQRAVNAFAISQFEVTFDAWDACFQDGGCSRWPDDMGWGRGGRPVINVSWQDTTQFTSWLSMKTGQHYRLPSEVEWEYAARGGMTTVRYWGNDLGQGRANCAACGAGSASRTVPVGSFAANRFGLYDMLGNVWEWSSDCWGKDAHCKARVIRGGAYTTTGKGVRAAARSGYPAANATKNIGFRVVRSK